MTHTIAKIFSSIAVTALLCNSCTKKFEEFNSNPYGATNDQLSADRALVVAQLQERKKPFTCISRRGLRSCNKTLWVMYTAAI